jgi:hypothetical protein
MYIEYLPTDDMKFSVTLLAIKDACDGPNRNRGAVTD